MGGEKGRTGKGAGRAESRVPEAAAAAARTEEGGEGGWGRLGAGAGASPRLAWDRGKPRRSFKLRGEARPVPPQPQPPRRGGRAGGEGGGEGGPGRSELGKTERALRRAGGRRGEGGGRMEQVEILRRFIQRVQAMKSPDHNGEDNFARDFMVSVRPSRRRRHPRVSVAGPPGAPLTSPPSRPGPGLRQRFVCGARAQRPARSASLAGGEVATAPPWPRFSAAREPRERPPGPARSGPSARDSLLSPRPGGRASGRRRLGCGLACPRPPSPPAPPGRVGASRRAAASGAGGRSEGGVGVPSPSPFAAAGLGPRGRWDDAGSEFTVIITACQRVVRTESRALPDLRWSRPVSFSGTRG